MTADRTHYGPGEPVRICLHRDPSGVRCDQPEENHYTEKGQLRKRGPLAHEPVFIETVLNRRQRRKVFKTPRQRPAPQRHWLQQIKGL